MVFAEVLPNLSVFGGWKIRLLNLGVNFRISVPQIHWNSRPHAFGVVEAHKWGLIFSAVKFCLPSPIHPIDLCLQIKQWVVQNALILLNFPFVLVLDEPELLAQQNDLLLQVFVLLLQLEDSLFVVFFLFFEGSVLDLGNYVVRFQNAQLLSLMAFNFNEQLALGLLFLSCSLLLFELMGDCVDEDGEQLLEFFKCLIKDVWSVSALHI